MMPPLHKIVGVSPNASWRAIDLDQHADASHGVWLGIKRSKTNPLLNPDYCTSWVEGLARRKSVDYTYGGYMENRSTLWRGHYMKRGHFIHYGVDINVPAGTEVRCPLHFTVCEVWHRDDQHGGWGCRVTVATDRGFVVFAHLDLTEPLHVGRTYQAGYRIGLVASSSYNGGWYPHLHLQGLRSLDQLQELDGYGKRYSKMRFDYPDPLDILLPYS